MCWLMLPLELSARHLERCNNLASRQTCQRAPLCLAPFFLPAVGSSETLATSLKRLWFLGLMHYCSRKETPQRATWWSMPCPCRQLLSMFFRLMSGLFP